MKITPLPVGDCVINPANPKLHDDDQVRRISESINAFGFNVPVLVDEQNTLIAGHGRYLAARKLGLESVPSIRLDHLNEVQKKAFMLADNRLQEMGGGWDNELLNIDLADLQSADFDLALTGFCESDFQAPDASQEDDFSVENQTPDDCDEKNPCTRQGDIWQLGDHTLLCGDSTNQQRIADYLQGQRADLMFTDPPYGVNYVSSKHDTILGDQSQAVIPISFSIALDKALNANARIYVCGANRNIQMYFALFNLHLKRSPSLIIWIKENILLRRNNYHSQYELIFFGWKGKGGADEFWYGGRGADNCSDVFQIHRDHSKDYVHPTQKPVELALRCITNSSQPGDRVYEPFAGSGSTLIACEKSGRRCKAVELDPFFCDVIVRRWETYTQQQALLSATGQTFETVSHERQKTPSH